jgi:hypothetical protein
MDLRPALFINRFFVIATIISFIYSLFGGYNGDFLGIDVSLSFMMLFFNLILTLIPYFVFWKIYVFFKKKKNTTVFASRQVNILFVILCVLFVYNFFAVVIYSVGVAEAPVYDAPIYIKPIIQIMNRVNFGYFALYYILISKRFHLELIAILMLLIMSYLYHGMGVFLFIMFVYSIKYYDKLVYKIKKNIFIFLISICLSPIFITSVYSLRDELRGTVPNELSFSEFIFGKFIGRLSSFSNSAMILQEPAYFYVMANTELDKFYYQIQTFKGLFGGDYKEKKPELYMKGIFGNAIDVNSAFMTGTQGNAMISFLISPFHTLLNMFTLFIMVFFIFKLSTFFHFEYSYELAFLLAIYPITSGVPTEFVIIITTFIFIIFCNILISTFNKQSLN